MAKPYRLANGDRLYLYVAPSGVKSWQHRYRLDGRPQTLTLGKADPLTLVSARDAVQQAREKASLGVHLTIDKCVSKAIKRADRNNTFTAVAADWIPTAATREVVADYRIEVQAGLRNHLFKLDDSPLAGLRDPAN